MSTGVFQGYYDVSNWCGERSTSVRDHVFLGSRALDSGWL